MAPPADSAVLADTILRSATDGYYPDSEDIAGADLTTSHLPTILASLQAAKDEVKEQVRAISRKNAAEVDSWIVQAQQLHTAIEASKIQADEISRLDAEEKALAQALNDAEMQQRFLASEIRFNEDLASMLGKLQLIGATIAQVDFTIERGELDQAVGILNSAEGALERLQGFDEIIIVTLIKEKAKALRKVLLDRTEEAWNALVSVEKDKGSVTIRKSAEVSSVAIESETVIATLNSLGLLKDKIDHFHQQIDRLLIAPRLETQEGRIPTLAIEGNTLRISGQDNDLRAARLFSDLRLIIDFLDSHLPKEVMTNLSRTLVPNLTSKLISTRLSSSVPPSLDDLPAFEELLEETKRFEGGLHKTDWTRDQELSDWVERAPKVWLAKRREWSLDTARTILSRGILGVETVERSETETIQAEDGQGAMVAGVAEVSGADDWNVAWNDDEEDQQAAPSEKPKTKSAEPVPPAQPAGFMADEDDDGADGWGLDEDLGFDDTEEPEEPEPTPASTTGATPESSTPEELNDEEIDWGAWGDGIEDVEYDDDSKPPSHTGTHPRKASVSKHAAPQPQPQPQLRSQPQSQPTTQLSAPTNRTSTTKDVTLTETYTITSIPRALLDLVATLLSEANQLQTNPQYMTSPIAPAASGIRSIPTLVLSVFRALAPLYYNVDLKSNMYLYNDCTYLSSQLPEGINEKDVSQILIFGKRQYSREMEAQRTIFCDYLDGAQGFASCTEPLQRQECDRAITAVIQHLCSLHTAWQSVLSKSALYQTIGSLLNTVVTKLINDIEDLSDISEPESVALARYCADIAELEHELFPGRTPDAVPVTPIYCDGWMKFRYLEQILGSSMKEIMALVREGALREFETEELVELVRALFADSEFRSGCIEDIRGGMH